MHVNTDTYLDNKIWVYFRKYIVIVWKIFEKNFNFSQKWVCFDTHVDIANVGVCTVRIGKCLREMYLSGCSVVVRKMAKMPYFGWFFIQIQEGTTKIYLKLTLSQLGCKKNLTTFTKYTSGENILPFAPKYLEKKFWKIEKFG